MQNDTSNEPDHLADQAARMASAPPQPKYAASQAQRAQLDKVFTYHAPKADQPQRYNEIRDLAKKLATLIVETTPASREQSLAMTHLEESVMWANAAIARNE